MLRRAAQHELLAQRANGQQLAGDGQQHDQRGYLQRRQQYKRPAATAENATPENPLTTPATKRAILIAPAVTGLKPLPM